MFGKKKRSPFNFRLMVGVAVAVLFILGIVQVAQGFIDTRNYRELITKIVKEQTGRDITIKGKVTIALLPTPTLYIPGVELRGEESDTPIPAITVDMIKGAIPFGSVFSDRPHLSGITLQHPVLELVRAKDNLIHWDWLNATLLKALSAEKDPNSPLTLSVSDGKILYHDNRTDKGTAIENITFSATAGTRLGTKGMLTVNGHNLAFSIDTNPDKTAPPAGFMPLHARIDAGSGTSLQLSGSMNLAADAPKLQGKLELAVADALAWTGIRNGDKPQMFDKITGTAQKELPLMPIALSGDWLQDGLNISLSQIGLKGLQSEGKGKVTLTWNDWQPSFDADMHFSTLDYGSWKMLTQAVLASQSTPDINPYNPNDREPENPLPAEVNASLALTADELHVGPQLWKNARVSAALADATLTVNQFTIDLPGESTLNLFGIISQGNARGLRFEGSMESSGKSLRQMLTVFDESAGELPDTGFGEFSIHSNMFISSEQVRLSEADVKISDLRLNGGLVAYYDASPRIEADIKLKDINFDYFRNVWREHQQETQKQNFFLKFDKTMNFNWLKKLQLTVDLKVGVEGFTFMEKKGTLASFRIFAKESEFGIYDMRFAYPGEATEASFNIDVKGEQPMVNLVLNAASLDTAYFSTAAAAPTTNKTLVVTPQAERFTLAQDVPPSPTVPPKPAETVEDIQPAAPAKDDAPPAKMWSEDLFDMSWMDGFNASFDISIGKLKHGGMSIDNLKMQAKLTNNLLNFQNLSFTYWQGQCSVLGSMYGGKVPGISLSFTLFNAELHDILKDLANPENISGKTSISGTLTTSGVNPLSWVSQSDAKLIITGRGVTVQGLNLQGAMDAVNISRTAADVFNNVNLALTKGNTQFSVDGNLNVKNGVVRTPGITLKTENNVLGNLTGEVRLVSWTMDLSTLFQFPGLPSETIPTMTVQLSGPVADGTLTTDTSSLEAYVAKRIISK